jgi:hypothetical protein
VHANVARKPDIDVGVSLVYVTTTAAYELNSEGSDLRFCIRPAGITLESLALIYPHSSITGDENVGNPRISQVSVQMGKHRPKIGKKFISREFFPRFGGICTPFVPVED